VEQHVYGRDGAGRELLRCYQLAGESTSRHRAGWQLLRAGDIPSVEVVDIRFLLRADYKPGDRAIREVFP
jgi:hypothetical protein